MKNKIIGIYRILNIINNKSYIGQSSNIKDRWRKHKEGLRSNRHHNYHLQYAWNKYGEQCFKFIIVEEIDLDIINDREKYWIDFYDTFNNGYNLSVGGNGCRGYFHTEDQIMRIRKRYNSPSIIQLSKNGEYIKKWNSCSQAAKALGLFSSSLKDCCERRNYMKSVGGFVWIYENDRNSNLSYYFLKKNAPKAIIQYDKEMNFIKKWGSARQASRELKIDHSSISSVCRKESKTAGGYIWTFCSIEHIEGGEKIA